MNYQFFKYEGCGNDFVILDDRTNKLELSVEIISNLCDRRFGIGADGLLLLRSTPEYDFRMVYYNADGSRATMCGNGARCLSAFAHKMGTLKSSGSFVADDGPHTAEILYTEGAETQVSISMKDATPDQNTPEHLVINTGTPHYVLFVDDIKTVDVVSIGSKIRYSEEFAPIGTNVNFVQLLPHGIVVRTYEKGVEDETLACGTGVTASAMAASLKTGLTSIPVKVMGGDLHVSFTKTGTSFTNVVLTGPARLVFEGEINI